VLRSGAYQPFNSVPLNQHDIAVEFRLSSAIYRNQPRVRGIYGTGGITGDEHSIARILGLSPKAGDEGTVRVTFCR
jgi:hypothetical protein